MVSGADLGDGLWHCFPHTTWQYSEGPFLEQQLQSSTADSGSFLSSGECPGLKRGLLKLAM